MIAGDEDLCVRFDDAFEDTVVVGIVTNGIDGCAGRDEFSHAPEDGQGLLEDGLRPVEFFGEDAAECRTVSPTERTETV